MPPEWILSYYSKNGEVKLEDPGHMWNFAFVTEIIPLVIRRVPGQQSFAKFDIRRALPLHSLVVVGPERSLLSAPGFRDPDYEGFFAHIDDSDDAMSVGEDAN